MNSDAPHRVHRRLVRTISFSAKIPGQNAQVVVQLAHSLDQGVRHMRIHVQMQIADVQNPETLECRRQRTQHQVVVRHA